MANSAVGFQPRTTPAERRAFFDTERKITDIERRLDAHDTKLAELEARIVALETP